MSRKKSGKSISLPFELPSNFDEWVAKGIFIGKIALTSLIVSVLVQLLLIKVFLWYLVKLSYLLVPIPILLDWLIHLRL